MLTMKDIIREGNDSLTKKALDVALPLSETDKEILFSLLEYIKNSQDDEIAMRHQLRPSVGLAAPQINVLKRMIAVHTTDEKNEVLYSYMLINPKIVSYSEEMTYIPQGEGCLSVDREVPGIVLRHKRITVKGYQLKEDGEVVPVSLRLKGYVAIVFQHEIDHLNGVLFTERINNSNPFEVDPNIKPIVFE